MIANNSLLWRALMMCLLVGSVLAPVGIVTPVEAQSTTTTPTDPEPTTGPSLPGANNTTTTESHWMGNSSGGGLLGGGSFGVGPKAWYDTIINATREKLTAALRWQIGGTVSLWIGTPYDRASLGGSPSVPTIKAFSDAMGGLRTDVYGAYVFPFLVMLVAIFLTLSAVAIPASTMFYGASLTRWMGKIGMAIIIVGISYDFINILQQTSNAIAWGIAPTPDELTSSMAGLFKLGVGPALGAVGLYFGGWVEALALSLVYSFRQIFLMMAPSVMPLVLVIAYGAPHKRLRGFGSTMFWQWFNLCFINIPVAIMLRIAFELDWSFGVGGMVAFVLTLAIFLGALLLPFLTGYAFLKYPMTGVAMGTANKAGERVSNSREDGWLNTIENSKSDTPAKTSETNTTTQRVVATDGGSSNDIDADDFADDVAEKVSSKNDSAKHIRDLDKATERIRKDTTDMRKKLSRQYRDRRNK